MKKESKVLVVFYSRTGTTQEVAEVLSQELGGELVEVHTKHYPRGLRGYYQAALDAALGRAVPIRSKIPSASSYDLVVVGTPIWNASLSAPIRTYLAQALPRAKYVAFFLTYGGGGADRVFKQMKDLVGQQPLATMALTDSEIDRRKYTEKLEGFVKRLRKGTRVAKVA